MTKVTPVYDIPQLVRFARMRALLCDVVGECFDDELTAKIERHDIAMKVIRDQDETMYAVMHQRYEMGLPTYQTQTRLNISATTLHRIRREAVTLYNDIVALMERKRLLATKII